MNLQGSIVSAVFRRNFNSYFSNPVGYLFIVAFTLVSAYFAFNDQFFAANMADLDQLNQYFPLIVLLLVPAITMNTWAEERRSGTEELLLTLPGGDFSIVLGKYLASLAIYSVALAFSTIYIILLSYLGGPDYGMMVSTYFGYWLIGAALLSAGMVASLLTSHTTVAFILGVLLCGVLIGVARVNDLLTFVGGLFNSLRLNNLVSSTGIGDQSSGFTKDVLSRLSVEGAFRPFGQGLITLSGVLYFAAVTGVMLYMNVFLLGRRHWAGGKEAGLLWTHAVIRLTALIVATAALLSLAKRADAWVRVDATSEHLHTLSKESIEVLNGINPEREVRIDAFLSPVKELPKEYIETQRDLREALLQYEAQARGKIRLNIVEAELFSPAAARADKTFGIKPVRIAVQEDGRFKTYEFLLGVSVRSGRAEATVPFFYKGLSIEYELTRLVRTVISKDLPKVAVLGTEADVLARFGGEEGDWLIVSDLRKQYKVLRATPGQLLQHEEKDKKLKLTPEGAVQVNDALKDVKVLIVPLASLLGPEEMDDLIEYVRSGRPTLILDDPFPAFNPQLAPQLPKMPDQQMQMFGMRNNMQPKGDLTKLTDMLGVTFDTSNMVWQTANPLRQGGQHQTLPMEFVASGRNVGPDPLYNTEHPITQGMRDYVLFMFGGGLEEKGGDGPRFTKLLWTTQETGTTPFSALQEAQRGNRDLNNFRRRTGKSYTLAAYIEGKPVSAKNTTSDKPTGKAGEVKVVFITDIDFISNTFFEFRRQGDKKLDFENAGFIVNCVDFLAGDASLIPLRQKRAERHTLKKIIQISDGFEKEAGVEIKAAKDEAEKKKEEAQKRLDERVKGVKGRSLSSAVQRAQQQMIEQKIFEREQEDLQRKLEEKIRDAQLSTQQKVRVEQDRIRLLAILLPPLPALLLGLVVWMIRSNREIEGVNRTRLR